MLRYRRGDHGHRTGDIGCVADRRQVELHRAFGARCYNTPETERQSGRAAVEGARRGLAGRRSSLRTPHRNLWFHPQTPVVVYTANQQQNFLFW